MKNKLFYLTLLFVSALSLASCASRKYGCPNSTGLKSPASCPARVIV